MKGRVASQNPHPPLWPDSHIHEDMVKEVETSCTYDYSWDRVTAAFFQRYPNDYSKHVLTADVLDRHIDTETGQLHTTRLLTKTNRKPKWMDRVRSHNSRFFPSPFFVWAFIFRHGLHTHTHLYTPTHPPTYPPTHTHACIPFRISIFKRMLRTPSLPPLILPASPFSISSLSPSLSLSLFLSHTHSRIPTPTRTHPHPPTRTHTHTLSLLPLYLFILYFLF